MPLLRSLVAGGLLAGSLAASSTAFAEPAVATAPAASPARSSRDCTSSSDQQDLLGILFDGGQGPVSFGARYVHDRRSSSGCGGLGFSSWLGYGVQLRDVGVSAGIAQAVGRAGMMGDAAAMGVELAAGAGTDFGHTTLATGTASLLFDLDYIGLGASYEFPVGAPRPGWLGAWEFSLRVHVPLSTYDVVEKRTPRP